jgi:hypothetical protein
MEVPTNAFWTSLGEPRYAPFRYCIAPELNPPATTRGCCAADGNKGGPTSTRTYRVDVTFPQKATHSDRVRLLYRFRLIADHSTRG